MNFLLDLVNHVEDEQKWYFQRFEMIEKLDIT